ncbi:MAG: DUF3800 domain-containing protein [Candidatus Atribacteria bacterium]|nr:DUF3800 domain-containing protein [Candidatus Atribacteria bacterium]
MINIYTKNGKSQIEGNSLIVFVDETGNEYLKDKEYPIFGLGGCAVICKEYNNLIRKPWYNMKDTFFDGKENKLHAKDLFQPTMTQINAISDFFKKNKFARIAAVMSYKTINKTEYDIYNIVTSTLYKRILDVAKWTCFNSIILIVEDSERCNSLAKKFFPSYKFEEYDYKLNKKTNLPSKYLFLSKDKFEPGMEVADFIIHTAGAQLRDRINKKNLNRKDFEVVFQSIDKKLSSCIFIDKINKRDK